MAIPSCSMSSSAKSVSIMQCLRLIVQTEGSRALFKGLGPNIVGVAPSRAIYFCAYSQTKTFLNNQQWVFLLTLCKFCLANIFIISHITSRQVPSDSPIVHLLSASCAGFAASTTTNPIWFVKTRLQLDYNSKDKMTVAGCIRRIYQTSGLLGFYKGISASYVGISETVIHFVIYEALKAKLVSARLHYHRPTSERAVLCMFFRIRFDMVQISYSTIFRERERETKNQEVLLDHTKCQPTSELVAL